MKDGVILSDRWGVNPAMLLCEFCGAEYGVGLLGKVNKHTCKGCAFELYGKAGGSCPSCGRSGDWYWVEYDVEGPRQAVQGLCDACMAKQDEARAAVEAGGVFWRCKVCGSDGAIKASEYAAAVRESAGVESGPVGVEFEGAPECPVCSDRAGGDNNDGC